MIKNKRIKYYTHILIWVVLFNLPYILSYDQNQDIKGVFEHFWIPLTFYAILFYLNFIVLIDKFLFTKKTFQFIILNIVIIIVFLLLREYINHTFFVDINKKPPKIRPDNGPPPFDFFIYIQILSYLVPLLFSIAIKTTYRWRKTEIQRNEATNFKLQSELQHLKYQLQPHFFFNALNNIYYLVDNFPNQAKSSIHSLGKLMRYMLYETNTELVMLSNEIDFMIKYIDLMKLRISENTKISYTFPTNETHLKIAPLLFITLLENAFKHGVSANKKSLILINMSIIKNKIIFTVENNNFPKDTNDKSGSGIGIQNLEKRLQILYPNKYSFETSLKENCFLATLIIEI